MKNLGSLNGALLVFGGVYSNWQALEALQEEARRLGMPPSNIICTGDIVAYCASPEPCVQAVRHWGIHCISGNVEQQLASGAEDCGCDFADGSRCDMFSRHWYPFAQANVSADSLEWMRQLPERLRFRWAGIDWAVLHGSCSQAAGYVFKSTPWEEKAKQLDEMGVHGVLAGHCGLPFSHSEGGRHWLNPGVIGMPANDGTPRVWYMVLEETEDGFKARHKALHYSYKRASAMMRQAQLPQAYSLTLVTGIWDNCDILPAEEAALQGIRIGLDDA